MHTRSWSWLVAIVLVLPGFGCSKKTESGPGGEPKARPLPVLQAGPDQTMWKDEVHPAGDAPRIDIAFCLDATGSMSSLIAAAKNQILNIYKELEAGDPRPSVRVAVVAYRDRKDSYITRLYGFSTRSAQAQKALADIQADGGGDEPEHVVAGLRRTVKDLGWDPKAALRIIFLMGDAPPHLDYGPDSDVGPVLEQAKKQGLMIGAIAYGKMADAGQKFWKQVADATGGPTEGLALAGEQMLESMLLHTIRTEAAKSGIRY